MKISPLEIRTQEFKKSLRGYDESEVQAFLQMVSMQWQELTEDARRLEERIRELETKIDHYQRVEGALQEALETTKVSSKAAMEDASRRASLIIEEAKMKAGALTRDAEQATITLRHDTTRLVNRQTEILAKLRAFLSSEIELLDHFEGERPQTGAVDTVVLPESDREMPRADQPVVELARAKRDVHRGPTIPAESMDTTHADLGRTEPHEPTDVVQSDEPVKSPDVHEDPTKRASRILDKIFGPPARFANERQSDHAPRERGADNNGSGPLERVPRPPHVSDQANRMPDLPAGREAETMPWQDDEEAEVVGRSGPHGDVGHPDEPVDQPYNVSDDEIQNIRRILDNLE